MMGDAPHRPVDLTALSGTNLNLLVPLLALLEEGSITEAAARVGARHSAMVLALSRLRSMHHDELLIGHRADRALTPYGAALVAPLRGLLHEASHLLNLTGSAAPPPGHS